MQRVPHRCHINRQCHRFCPIPCLAVCRNTRWVYTLQSEYLILPTTPHPDTSQPKFLRRQFPLRCKALVTRGAVGWTPGPTKCRCDSLPDKYVCVQFSRVMLAFGPLCNKLAFRFNIRTYTLLLWRLFWSACLDYCNLKYIRKWSWLLAIFE